MKTNEWNNYGEGSPAYARSSNNPRHATSAESFAAHSAPPTSEGHEGADHPPHNSLRHPTAERLSGYALAVCSQLLLLILLPYFINASAEQHFLGLWAYQTAHFLIDRLFGLTAFFLPVGFFLIGGYVLLEKREIGELVRNLLITALWFFLGNIFVLSWVNDWENSRLAGLFPLFFHALFEVAIGNLVSGLIVLDPVASSSSPPPPIPLLVRLSEGLLFAGGTFLLLRVYNVHLDRFFVSFKILLVWIKERGQLLGKIVTLLVDPLLVKIEDSVKSFYTFFFQPFAKIGEKKIEENIDGVSHVASQDKDPIENGVTIGEGANKVEINSGADAAALDERTSEVEINNGADGAALDNEAGRVAINSEAIKIGNSEAIKFGNSEAIKAGVAADVTTAAVTLEGENPPATPRERLREEKLAWLRERLSKELTDTPNNASTPHSNSFSAHESREQSTPSPVIDLSATALFTSGGGGFLGTQADSLLTNPSAVTSPTSVAHGEQNTNEQNINISSPSKNPSENFFSSHTDLEETMVGEDHSKFSAEKHPYCGVRIVNDSESLFEARRDAVARTRALHPGEPSRYGQHPRQAGQASADNNTGTVDAETMARQEMAAEQREVSALLEQTFRDFGIRVEVVHAASGPVITSYELKVESGVRLTRIVNLADNLALALASPSIRIVAPVPGKAVVGIEIPNRERQTVRLSEIVESPTFIKSPHALSIALGSSILGTPVVADLARMPHLLVAGATGSGKSVLINALISSLMISLTPNQIRFLMVDPKMVELNVYNSIPHLLTPVISDPKEASLSLRWLLHEMEARYRLLEQRGARSLQSYHQLLCGMPLPPHDRFIKGALPYIVVIIDEFADLMMVARKDVEDSITRLAAMSRAVGIHLLLATQRPSVDVITGVIKANFPSRVAFQVSSKVDSRTIIDAGGAEKLLGQGDMLFSSTTSLSPERIQGAFLSDQEVVNLIATLKAYANPYTQDRVADILEYDPTEERERDLGAITASSDKESLLSAALSIAQNERKISASYLQRRLKIGYNRAARIVETMEERGWISPADGVKPREILVS